MQKLIPEQFSFLTGSLRVLSVVLLKGIIIGQDNLYRVLTWASSQVSIRHLGYSRPSLGRNSKYKQKHSPDRGTWFVLVDLLGRTAFGSPNSIFFSNPKMDIKQIEQFSDIILRMLRFLAESSGVTKLELFQPFPHCK